MKKLNRKSKTVVAIAFALAFFIGVNPIPVFAYTDETESEIEEIAPMEEVEEDAGPLTPDGNLDLVDDFGTEGKTGKQFITVVTKTGNYFYIIIDRDDNGNENVHFLNMVDERDLLSLMEDEEVEEYLASIEQTVSAPEPISEPTQEEVEPVEEPQKKSINTSTLIIFPIMGRSEERRVGKEC